MGTSNFKWTVIGLVVVVATCARAAAETINIVTPAAARDKEGNATATPGANPIRIQHLILASDFANLPASHRILVAFNFRADQSQTQSLDWTHGDEKVWLSTTDKNVLTTSFEGNHGADKALVHDGPLPFPLLATGPTAGPRDIAPGTRLDTPFVYDPSKGNLLVDRLTFSSNPSARANIDTLEISQATVLLNADNPQAPLGLLVMAPAVLQFEFVPEPSAALLAGVALVGMFARRRKFASGARGA